MRSIPFAIAVALVATIPAACSDTTEDAADPVVVTDEASVESMDVSDSATVLDANVASADQLVARGLSPELAEAIVAGRPYADASELNAMLVEQAGADEAADTLATVFVPVDLNSATREEIGLIPGMTDRMAGEFLEYRPYEDMAEFDREIGKYVDEEEVARLRGYVTL